VLEVRRARPDEIDTCLAIRHEVFVLGQGVPAPLEVDGKDRQCAHFIALERGQAIGTARLRVTDNGAAKVERVAVRPGHQGRGVGTAIMHAVEEEAAARGFREVVLTAQVAVLPFYETLGYVAEGKVFIEAAIKHRWMKKRLGAHA
jgi:predicted GNAT family N-acyltransferase